MQCFIGRGFFRFLIILNGDAPRNWRGTKRSDVAELRLASQAFALKRFFCAFAETRPRNGPQACRLDRQSCSLTDAVAPVEDTVKRRLDFAQVSLGETRVRASEIMFGFIACAIRWIVRVMFDGMRVVRSAILAFVAKSIHEPLQLSVVPRPFSRHHSRRRLGN